MKSVLELLAASALSVGVVVGGVVVASAALSPQGEEPPHQFKGLDIADLWTSEPVRIDRAGQDLERLPPRYASHVVMRDPEPGVAIASGDTSSPDVASEIAGIDLVATGAVAEANDEVGMDMLPQQHISWCEARYRSYDAASNTYRSFSGGMRDCESPYLIGMAQPWQESEGEFMTVSSDQTEMPEASRRGHANVQACMDRYRSYRVDDNTYQPYGGGPRQQCRLASF